MTVLSHRAVPLAVLSMLGVGLLSACATPAPSPVATDSETDAAASAPAEEVAPSGPECLIGDWFIAEDQMQGFYSAVSGSNENVDISVKGGTGLAFTNSGYTYTPDFAIILQVAGTEGEGTITGGVTGDYSATDTEITTSHDVSDVAVSVSVSGVTMDGTDLFGDFMSSSPINSAPYECGEVGPILHFDTGEGNPRVPMQLTPAS
ncbi:hypothetical protein [Salinibacterium sp. M195]|uniref:hypothetical protein n=1 Tax=Salinibacterium sp. M195 TaxID=2583374 RepID=UPI001C639882|nr:hypothetical protein [Salinibacterium sp. M195]QYH34610.1 hypothetical protein FFT87_00815 [Salinibacterium sp. M195]